METVFVEHPTYLSVVARGSFTVKEGVDTFRRILERCRSTGLSSVLIDFTELAPIEMATLRVMFAVSARELFDRHLAKGGQRLRAAFLGREESFLSWQPGMEAASRDRPGVRTFTNREAALAWLGITP